LQKNISAKAVHKMLAKLTAGLPPKPQFKKQKSITDLLCMPDTEPTVFSTPFTQPVQQQQQQHQQSSSPKIGKDPYNPYIQYKDDYQKSLTSPQPPQNYNVQPVISNYYPNFLEEKKEAPKPPPMPPVKVEPRPSATLPPPAPRGPPGRAPPAPPPPPPPGYLTEDLPEIGSSKQKTKRGKVSISPTLDAHIFVRKSFRQLFSSYMYVEKKAAEATFVLKICT